MRIEATTRSFRHGATLLLLGMATSCRVDAPSTSEFLPSADVRTTTWFERLPDRIRNSILWTGDVEEGTLDDWTMSGFENAGGGVFNTGEGEVIARASRDIVHSGGFSAEATINGAVRARNGNRAVRLMRWTNLAWDDGGDYFPAAAYFSAWIYLPEVYNPNKYAPWTTADGGWWNIFQFKSNDSTGASKPMWTLNVGHDDATGEMFLYLFSKPNNPNSYRQTNRVPLPAKEWVHVEAYYVQSQLKEGAIMIWQDGRQILQIQNAVTILAEPAVWGIGNYTDHIAGGPELGSATIYFDDGAVSTRPLHPFR